MPAATLTELITAFTGRMLDGIGMQVTWHGNVVRMENEKGDHLRIIITRDATEVADHGHSLHLIRPDGRTICGRQSASQDQFTPRIAGWRAWNRQIDRRCKKCEKGEESG